MRNNILPLLLKLAAFALPLTAIAQPTVTFVSPSPTAGAVYEQTDLIPISVQIAGLNAYASGNSNTRLYYDYSTDNGITWISPDNSWRSITNQTISDMFRIRNQGGSQYNLYAQSNDARIWEGGTPSATTQIRARLEYYTSSGSSLFKAYAISPTFTVKPISIQLLGPVGGEYYKINDLIPVRWKTTGFLGSISIALSVNNGISWTETYNSGWLDDSQQDFRVTLESGGTLRLTAPGGAEYYITGIPKGSANRIRVRAGNTNTYQISEPFTISDTPPPPVSNCRLVNLSTRAIVAQGGNLNPGFVVVGSGTQRVLVRGIGPGLAQYGVSGTMPDPILEVYSGQTRIAVNDNWSANASEAAALRTAFASTFAFALPDGSRDAAILLDLQPGNYTLTLRGVGGIGGDCIAEVYQVTY